MPCYRPISGFRSKSLNPNGKRSIVFSRNDALSVHPDDVVTLPCGRCIYCRLEHSRAWAVRAMHESSLYDENCFITLTYSPDTLPPNGALDYERPVAFMKALRQKFGSGIRSYGCAEYGEKLSRPHYHLCLFNHQFPDLSLFSNDSTNKLYTSKLLSSLWPDGHSTIGELTFESAAYVARYVTKKISISEKTPEHLKTHYQTPLGELPPERSICVSRRPGIGRTWFEKYKNQLLDHDYVISRGRKIRPPKYYDRLLELEFPEQMKHIKKMRSKAGDESHELLVNEDHQAMLQYFNRHDHGAHDVPLPIHRLTTMERVHVESAKILKRGLEK